MKKALSKAGVNFKLTCPYCERPAEKVKGDKIYPHREDLAHLNFFRCEPCDAYVGTHKETGKPYGRLANKELRQLKILVHQAFDPIWKSKRMERNEAYGWLAKKLGMARKDCHIGMFDIEACNRAIDVIEAGKQWL